MPEVVVATPLRQEIVEWDEYIGRLEALETVEVRARVSGYLATTHFNEGQIVQAGDLLAVVDQRPFIAEVTRSEANLLAAQAQLEQAKSAGIQADAEKKRTDIRRDLAQKLLTRTDQLRQRDVATIEEYEIQEAEFAEAESAVTVADANIEAAKSTVGAAKAAVEVAKANLELAKLNLQYTEIRAPITGRISRRYVTEGNLISGGVSDSTLLTTIVSVDPIHCYFDADEQAFLKYMQLAREGKRPSSREARNPIYLALADEKEGFPHWGHMDFVENRFDNDTGTIRARAILPNEHMDLAPGLFARVRIPGSPRYEAVLIPDRAIGTDQSDKFVFVIDEEHKVRRQVITLGTVSHGLRVIRSGLTGDEQIVVRGLQRARPGIEVAVTTETIVAEKESLPDKYEPVPEEKWLIPKRTAVGNIWIPDSRSRTSQTVNTSPRPATKESVQ